MLGYSESTKAERLFKHNFCRAAVRAVGGGSEIQVVRALTKTQRAG